MRTILNEQVRRYTTPTISTTSGEFGKSAIGAESLDAGRRATPDGSPLDWPLGVRWRFPDGSYRLYAKPLGPKSPSSTTTAPATPWQWVSETSARRTRSAAARWAAAP